MAASSLDPLILSEIIFYGREKLYRHIQQVVLQGQKKHGRNPVLTFWKAFSLMMDGSVAEAMREFQQLVNQRDVVLCTTLALLHAHKLSATVDREAVQQLDGRMREERKTCGEVSLYYAGLFLWMVGRHDKAREYVGRMLKMVPGTPEGSTLYGWIDLTCGRDSLVKKSVKYFDDIISHADTLGSVPVDCHFGKAKFLEMRHNYSHALSILNQAVVHFQGYTPAFIEKMRVQLALQDWDQAVDTAQRALQHSPQCLEAHQFLALWLLVVNGKPQEAASKLSEVLGIVDRQEPKNHLLYFNIARVFSRVAGRNALVLQQTLVFLERAIALAPAVAEYSTEMGYQLQMRSRGTVHEALKSYQAAMKLDETSVQALTGIIWCQLLEGDLEDAQQQLEFLNEIQSSVGKSSELCYLAALLAERKGQPAEEVLPLLGETTEAHLKQLKNIALGPEYYYRLNPDFLLVLVKHYLTYAPTHAGSVSSSPVLKSSMQILDVLLKAAPGLIEALYLSANSHAMAGNFAAAQTLLQRCLSCDQTYSPALLLLAKIALDQGDVKQSEQYLEVGFSESFEIRDDPLYHIIRARGQILNKKYLEAVRTLTAALAIPGVKTAADRPGKLPLQPADRASVFLNLAEAYRHLDQLSDTARVMEDAMKQFKGTSEEFRVIIANADVALDTNDVDSALGMLRTITPEQPYYIQAREKMATIYLEHRKDKKMFANCFREIVEKSPSSHSFILLGDAFSRIQEPEKAIEAYDTALKKDPRNGQLASKIGRALVRTHNYNKAINYYEAALKSGQQAHMRFDLAELYLKLRQFEKAERVLASALDQDIGDTLASRQERVRLLMLLADVYERSRSRQEAMESLARAKEQQAKVIKIASAEQESPAFVDEQRLKAANICCRSAEHAHAGKDNEAAIRLYQEALLFKDFHEKALLALAKLYLSMNNLEACQSQCLVLIRQEGDHDAATMMMADVLFRQLKYDPAMHHYQELLQKSPANYEALARLAGLVRRSGKLAEYPAFLQQAELLSTRSGLEPGLNFCKGLYERYTHNPTVALKHFNLARKDSEWGEHALLNMIEICLNPDNETLGGEVFAAVESDSNSSAAAEKLDSEAMAVRTAEKLMREVKPSSPDVQFKMSILEGYAMLASRSKTKLDRAVQCFMDLMHEPQDGSGAGREDNVPAIVGLSTAYMLMKQVPRARNQLKRILRRQWNSEDADDFEKGWLLMSDLYIQTNKYDNAMELLRKCLQYNRSCCKAWEYLGFISEKEGRFTEAANNYENAWRFSNRTSAAIGYKLAFNYMKAKRYVEAVDVCHQVLASNPNYPKIRKEILEKARSNIRV